MRDLDEAILGRSMFRVWIERCIPLWLVEIVDGLADRVQAM